MVGRVTENICHPEVLKSVLHIEMYYDITVSQLQQVESWGRAP